MVKLKPRPLERRLIAVSDNDMRKKYRVEVGYYPELGVVSAPTHLSVVVVVFVVVLALSLKSPTGYCGCGLLLSEMCPLHCKVSIRPSFHFLSIPSSSPQTPLDSWSHHTVLSALTRVNGTHVFSNRTT